MTIARDDGREHTYRVVGEDEADPSNGTISHVSPLARALFGKGVGDAVAWGRARLKLSPSDNTNCLGSQTSSRCNPVEPTFRNFSGRVAAACKQHLRETTALASAESGGKLTGLGLSCVTLTPTRSPASVKSVRPGALQPAGNVSRRYGLITE